MQPNTLPGPNPNGFAALPRSLATSTELQELIALTAPYRPVITTYITFNGKRVMIKISDPTNPNYPALDTPIGNIKFTRARRGATAIRRSLPGTGLIPGT